MADVLHAVYGPEADRRGPDADRAPVGQAAAVNRHAYNLSDGVAGSIDVALWDIVGKVANQPIALLLGMARDKVPAYRTASSVRPRPRDRLQRGEAGARSRASTVSRSSSGTASTRTSRGSAPPARPSGHDFPLMQDAAGMYSFTQALKPAASLGRLGYYWFEEPIPDRNTLQLKRLTHDLDVPILAGETLRVHELAEHDARRRLRHRPRRRPHEGGHHRPAQGRRHGRPPGLRPGGSRHRPAAARVREPPRRRRR